MNKKTKIILAIIPILFGLAVVVGVSVALRRLEASAIHVGDHVPLDYLNVFKPEIQNELLLQYAPVSFKDGSTIASLSYKRMYDIEITKIITRQNFIFNRDIVEINKPSKGIRPKITVPYDIGGFNVNYNGESDGIASKILLTLNGETINLYTNDGTTAYFYSNMSIGHLQYKIGGVYEISMKAKKKFYFFEQKRPIIVMLLKKGGSLYFITLRTINENKILNPDTLHNMVQT